jgi:hypothetical protein
VTVEVHDYRLASTIVPPSVAQETTKALTVVRPSPRAPQVRDEILKTLRNRYGWSDEISLTSDAKISITSKKSNIGLCLQTGVLGKNRRAETAYALLRRCELVLRRYENRSVSVLPSDLSEKGKFVAFRERYVDARNTIHAITMTT